MPIPTILKTEEQGQNLKNAMFINLKIKLIYPPYIGIIKQALECE